MTARHKLNAAYFYGALLISGLIGLVSGSWKVFLIALAALVVASIYAGDIRPHSGRR